MREVTTGQAVRLDRLGYGGDGVRYAMIDPCGEWETDNIVVVPSLCQAQEWLREIKGVQIWVIPHVHGHCAHVADRRKHHNLGHYRGYDDALAAAVEKAITLLENEV